MLKQIKKIPKEKVKIRKGYTRHKENKRSISWR